MMLQFGSTMFIYCCTERLVQDDRVRGNPFIIPGTWSVAAGTNCAGTLTRWVRDTLYLDYVTDEERGGPNAYDRMMQGLENIPPGSDGLITLPYFAGERTPINDPNAKGMLFGLKLSHTRAHIYRSALESVGFSVAQHLGILREQDAFPKTVMAVGGGTKTSVWMQIVADITGIPLHIPQVTIGASYGDALMAAIGVKEYPDFTHLRNIIRPAITVWPDQVRHEAYAPFRELYDALYLANRDLMHRL
jgi:xylulokinase